MLVLIAFRASSCRKRTYRGPTSSSSRRSGSSAAAGHSGITASSTEVLTRPGTTETSSTSRLASSSRRDARPSTEFCTEGGRSSAPREVSSSVTKNGLPSVAAYTSSASSPASEATARSDSGRELEEDRVVGADRAERGAERMRAPRPGGT